MFVAIAIAMSVGFSGSAAAQSQAATIQRPDEALTEALSSDAIFKVRAALEHVTPQTFVRRHFSETRVTLTDGTKLWLVRVVVRPFVQWCGVQNCSVQVWARSGAHYRKVLEASGQSIRLLPDGTAEIAAEDNAETEDYEVFRWDGLEYVKSGSYDTQGFHTSLRSATPITFDPGFSSATVTGNTGAAGPGVAYDITAHAGQMLTMTLSNAPHVSHLAIDRGTQTLAIASGRSLVFRLPADGTYRLVLLKGRVDFGSYSLDVEIH